MADKIRINMVVRKDEHPELHELLDKCSPKKRAAVMRKHADYSVGILKNQSTIQIPSLEASLKRATFYVDFTK